MRGGKIVDVRTQDADFVERLAALTHDAFRVHAPEWLPTIDTAREVVRYLLQPDHHCWAVVNSADEPLAWVGVLPEGNRVWEIHPIAVRPDEQGNGHGRRLIDHVESRARAAGILTLFASTSDETGATSLSNVDLYDDPAAAISSARWNPSHACGFWRRVGFQLVGVLPDAEGHGKPSIHFAKRAGWIPQESSKLKSKVDS